MGNLEKVKKIVLCNPETDERKLIPSSNKKREEKVIKEELGLKVHICGETPFAKTFEGIFNKKISKTKFNWEGGQELRNDRFYWIGKYYSKELSQETFIEILNTIKSDKSKKINQHVVIFFGEKNIDKFLEIVAKDKIFLPRIIFITENELETKNVKCSDKRYITNIVISKGITEDALKSQIISSLWELDCYFNERGNEICRYTPENIFRGLEDDLSFFSINILLTGKSRAGKSTFINLLAGKLLALESCANEPVTENVTRYFIHKEEGNKEQGAIQLIDTPGIDNDEKSKEGAKKVIDLIQNQDKSAQSQIHFILFFFNDGENLTPTIEILQCLNKSKCPVYFIVNRVAKPQKGDNEENEENEEEEDTNVSSTILFLKKNALDKLADEKNFILVNTKGSKRKPFFGVSDVFKKINDNIKENNEFNKNFLTNMKDLFKHYKSNIAKYVPTNLGSLTTDKEKEEEDYKNKVKEIKLILYKNSLFEKYNNIDSIIDNGKKCANNCEKIISFLSNLNEIMPNISKEIPMFTLLQSFMVKEIASGFGFNHEYCEFYTKLLLGELKQSLDENDPDFIGNINEKVIDKKNIEEHKETIKISVENKINSQKKTIVDIARLIENAIGKEKLEECINPFVYTHEISDFSIKLFSNELKESEMLPFLIYYYSVCQNIIEDIDFYVNKNEKDWEKKVIEVKHLKI